MKSKLIILALCFTLTLANEAALQEFTSGNNLFTSSVYKQIGKSEKGNFLVSPFSAETILALTQSGAKDATAEEVRTALHLPKSQEQIEAAVKTIQPNLRKNDLYTLQSANKIYVKNDFEIKDDFKKIATDVFESEIENINFLEREAAAKTMNGWVEGQTEHKIKNLIDSGDLNDRTRAILINALYLKGNWSIPFKKYRTFIEDFYTNGKDMKPVKTMHDTTRKNYFECEELKAKYLELPFEGGDITMTIVLPNEKTGIFDIEDKLEKVFEAPKYKVEDVKISIPKFKIETSLDFKEILQQLGVNKIFREDEADLSGIAGEKGHLIVDKVLQKTFIDVSEEGVEAAAATYVAVAVPLASIIPISPPKEFIADHPFIFYIKVKDLVLFAGRVMDPTY